MRRFIQYYDEEGCELIGSDGVWFFDQRWSNDTAMLKAAAKASQQADAYRNRNEDKRYAPQCAVYMSIMRGDLYYACPITGFSHIRLDHNPSGLHAAKIEIPGRGAEFINTTYAAVVKFKQIQSAIGKYDGVEITSMQSYFEPHLDDAPYISDLLTFIAKQL